MFEDMSAGMEERRKADSVPFLGVAAEHARYLKEKAALLAREDNLQVGDVVVWKPGLKGLNFPAEGEPVVITAFAPGEVEPDGGAALPDYKRPLDMRILCQRGDELLEWWVDARRFQKFIPDE